MRQVIVTGGGTGIGRAVAEWFVQRGDRVIVVGRRQELLERAAAEIGAHAVACDLSSPEAIQVVLAQLPDRVDVLVNNAGGNTDLQGPAGNDGDPESLSGVAQQWRANFDANVLTTVLTTAALEDRLADGGRVITVGSIAARMGADSYGAAKAALEAWNVSIASRLGLRRITANVVAPGLTEDTEFFHGRLSPQRREYLVSTTRTGRAGTPGDVAAVIGFLAAPEARHVTSQVIHVNGGSYSGH